MSAKGLLCLLTLIFIIFLVTFIFKITPKCGLLTTDSNVAYLELQSFHNYMKEFNKTYSAQEYAERLNNFKVSLITSYLSSTSCCNKWSTAGHRPLLFLGLLSVVTGCVCGLLLLS